MKLNLKKIAYDQNNHELRVGDMARIEDRSWATNKSTVVIHDILPLKRNIKIKYLYEGYVEESYIYGKSLVFMAKSRNDINIIEKLK